MRRVQIDCMALGSWSKIHREGKMHWKKYKHRVSTIYSKAILLPPNLGFKHKRGDT